MIEIVNTTATFCGSNSTGVFTLFGVFIGGVISFFIASYNRINEDNKIKRNLAQGYFVEICQIEKIIKNFLADESGALPKTLPIYPDSGMYLVTKKETLGFSFTLYKQLTNFYTHILKAEYHHRESYKALKEGMREYEIQRASLIEDLKKSKSETTGEELSKEEMEIILDNFTTASIKKGNLAFSDSLRADIEEEFNFAKTYIPTLKNLLRKEME